MAKKSDEESSTYLITFKDGSKQKVTLPTSWKVTFGPLVPGSKDGSYNSSGALCLRFYADQNHQKAVFTNVESSRDLSISVLEQVENKQAETFYKKDEDGSERAVVVEGSVKEWIDPDAPKQRAAGNQLPSIPDHLKR